MDTLQRPDPGRRLVEPGLLGIIGHPVRSSLSPAMQRAALRRSGLDARYQAFEIGPAQVRDVLRALAPLGFWGINVTTPYKEQVLPLVDEIGSEARAIGAINTIVVRRGRLIGRNTDAEGFRLALEVEGGTALAGARVIVLGAGGAARAVAFACLARRCASLVVANRTPERARALCRSLRARFRGSEITPLATGEVGAWAAAIAESAIVVNTTPPNDRSPVALPVPAGALRRGQTVMDIVYRPRRTPLLAAAAAAGARTVDGLQMLLHQGALAFSLWTGREAPLATMRRALTAAANAAERA